MTHRFLLLFTGMVLAAATLAAGPASTPGPHDWPSFRGPGAAGVANSATPPITWDLESGRHVVWSTEIPGLGHSSPVVWGDRVFVTTAVRVTPSGEPARDDVDPASAMRAPHAWRLYCLDRRTGRVVWERTAHQGVPRVKHHAKASHASATPATDGTHVVALMGSEGLFTYDMNGTLVWKRDLGRLNQGYVDDPTDEWGPASSPVLHNGMVIVQNDRHSDSFIAAFDVRTGEQRWRVGRDEMPSWATPVLHRGSRETLVTNSPKHIRGHDPATGRELWRIEDGTQVKVPSPVVAGDLIIVTGGWPTGGRPIFAIRAATGEIAWQVERGSSYTPTPVVYDGLLYVCVDNGILAAYDVRTGERIYQHRIARDAGGFSASPVAAAGRLYLASEDGVLYVVRAGRTFELLARNDMGEMVLATPAISGSLLLVRTRTRVVALGEV
ncbi:MAG TPA: PQQ-binding-like beta-propeller repeat protein [Vicinamibacterales bacterium]|nr:PQQ-binding-like beta-propeller repeat protein [Vicinamibacterales bacterium]